MEDKVNPPLPPSCDGEHVSECFDDLVHEELDKKPPHLDDKEQGGAETPKD